jgi:hypothetical protein
MDKIRKKEYDKQRYQTNKNKILINAKKYRENNKEKILKYREQNSKRLKQQKKEYYQKHREAFLEIQKEYHKNHIKEDKIYQKKYYIDRMKTDIDFKLAHSLRDRLRKAIKRGYKSGSAVRDLGCSIPELKIYLKSKFQVGMSWENYGYRGWHIDHIKPLDSFNLQNRKEFLKACHYTNLQPMWREDNTKKGNKYDF